ncbi:MAG: LemA family protein [Lachnospiraceae bacterium]
MKFSILCLLVLLLIAFAAFSWFVQTANQLTRYQNKARELESDVDVALTKRYDLLKKQYALVKQYLSHESQTLMETIRLRNGMSCQEKDRAMNDLNRISGQIRATFEAYPTLRSNENVMALQKSCDNVEEHLQAARRLYNTGVTNYNNLCLTFPSSIVASFTGKQTLDYFRADAVKREDYEFDQQGGMTL